MAWQVFPVIETVYQGTTHRLLEIEADEPLEMENLVAKSLSKGWQIYVEGTRPDSNMTVVMMVKAVSAST
ncbi:MAG: hypothetical protein Q7U28_09280 [Aquabacterium sp.]|nr:hypothetical protein [Aquabacterium sp.]